MDKDSSDDEKDAKHVSEPDSTMPTRTRSRKRAATEPETASDSDAATAKQGAKGKFTPARVEVLSRGLNSRIYQVCY